MNRYRIKLVLQGYASHDELYQVEVALARRDVVTVDIGPLTARFPENAQTLDDLREWSIVWTVDTNMGEAEARKFVQETATRVLRINAGILDFTWLSAAADVISGALGGTVAVAGEAAGAGASTAAQGVSEGASQAVEAVTEGATSIVGRGVRGLFSNPWFVVPAVVLAVGAVAYYVVGGKKIAAAIRRA